MSERIRDVLKLLLEMGDDEVAEVYSYMRNRVFSGERRSDMFVSVMNDILGVDIRERSRRHPVVWGRFIVISELLEYGWSTTLVGNVFGLDHATVTHAKKQVEIMLNYPRQFVAEFDLYKEFKRRICR